MGKATIVSGGDKGLYTVTVDYDRDYIDTRLEWIDIVMNDLVSERDIAAAAVITMQGIFDSAAADLADAITEMNAANAAATDKTTDPTVIRTTEETKTITKAYATAANDLTQASSRLADIKMRLEALGAERLLLLDVPQDYETEIWCADYVENLAEGAVVATIETPNNGLNIDVAYTDQAAFTQADDGQVTPAAEQSPAAVYYNLAMKGPWEKWRAKFRVGTITKIYLDEDTGDPVADILLDEAYATEIKQIGGGRIDINQTPDLIAVPFEYMDCDFRAFAIEDRVIIGFTYQAWNAPKVIGFESNPKQCPIWKEDFRGVIYSMGRNRKAEFPAEWIQPSKSGTPAWDLIPNEDTFNAVWGPYWQENSGALYGDWLTVQDPNRVGYSAVMSEDHHKIIAPFGMGSMHDSYFVIDGDPLYPGSQAFPLVLLPGDCEYIVLPDASPSFDIGITSWGSMEVKFSVSGPVTDMPGTPGIMICLYTSYNTDWLRWGWNPAIGQVNSATCNPGVHYIGIGLDIPEEVASSDTVDQAEPHHGFYFRSRDFYYYRNIPLPFQFDYPDYDEYMVGFTTDMEFSGNEMVPDGWGVEVFAKNSGSSATVRIDRAAFNLPASIKAIAITQAYGWQVAIDHIAFYP